MATDFYLKLDGCEGESQKEGHVKEIEIVSWSWSGHNSGSFSMGMGGGTGKFSAGDISMQALVSKASSKLIQACTKGSHIDKGVLSCRKSGGDTKPYDYLKLTFEHCLVSSYGTGGSEGNETILDSFTINFSKITYEYFVQDASKGTVSSSGSIGYDLSKGNAV